ncbi:putative transcription regulator, AraC family protein [Pseudonocardia sulfidoxydans NBRC 16205]|uniref:Putative transcription regulator, AraC family protein n=1 Tax=Pseudonocardia sulfidoxydans NBRC 16205 TaxID=1223511 RepID=A0A511DJS8_9PSEU|nr:putative transcription regulator, AraC family protein [Pseudonocardia sulfidoxydans NBRC 16205]
MEPGVTLSDIPARRTHTVAVLVYDGVRLLDVAVSMGAPYQVLVCSPDGRDARTSGGLPLGVGYAADSVSDLDTLVVPGGECLVTGPTPTGLLDAVKVLAAGAGRVTSVCAGSFALAAAGLLDGRRATTHWRHTATLAQRYPAVSVDEDSIYVRDGEVLTSAGVSAGIDLALALVEDDHGDELAHAIAKDLVVFTRRRGTAPQMPVPAWTTRPRRPQLRTLCDEIVADPAADHSLAALARRAGLSVRHLSRLFRQEVGCSPTAFVATVRLAAARTLLDSGETGASAARRSGMGSEETLRRALRRGPTAEPRR